MDNLIKRISILEEHIYILENLINKDKMIKESFFLNLKTPQKPVEPKAVRLQEIPSFDVTKYNTLAKKKGAGLSQFREDCLVLSGFLASSVIGLVVCWIPLLLLFLSWPFSIGHQRRVAYKMYTKECQEIEECNKRAHTEIERYNRDIVVYEEQLNEYNRQKQLLPNKEKLLNEEMNCAKGALQQLLNTRRIMYNKTNIPNEHQYFIPIHMILYYQDAHGTTLQESLALYNENIKEGKVVADLERVKSYKDVLQKNMPTAIRALEECIHDEIEIREDLIDFINMKVNTEKEVADESLLRKYTTQLLQTWKLTDY